MRKSAILASFVVGAMIVIGFGCGRLETNQSTTGSIAPAAKNSGGGALYQKYKDKFPANLEQISAEAMISKLTSYVIQAADGTTVEVLVTTDVAQDVVNQVEESYPAYDPEKFANDRADEILKEHGLDSAIMSGDTSEAGAADISEEAVKAQIHQALEAKENRMDAEKNYMIYSELAEPDVQNRIKASVTEIQNAINAGGDLRQYVDLRFGGRGLNASEVRLLWWRPQYWIPTIYAAAETLNETKRRFGNYDDNKLPNSFQHSYWNTLLAKGIEGYTWFGKGDVFNNPLKWAEQFSSAHEDYAGNPPAEKNMDLHNNITGRRMYDRNSWDDPMYFTICRGWVNVSVWYRTIVRSRSMSEFSDLLYNKANNANECKWVKWNGSLFVENPGADILIYIWDNHNNQKS